MRYLYLDNFRGFKNTTIPILDVNFLVGENSTGKTSVLTMLGMLSNPSLILGPQMVTGPDQPIEAVRFGHFAEMVSAHSSDKSYFRLGIMHSAPVQKKGEPFGAGLLITFRELDGLPSVSQFTSTVQQGDLTLRIETDHVSFKFSATPPIASAMDMANRLAKWAEQHSKPVAEGWKRISPPKGLNIQQLPPFLLMSIASSFAKNGDIARFHPTLPNIGPGLIWIAPIRTKALRTYDEAHTPFSPEGTHTPYIIRRMLASEEEAKKFRQFIDKTVMQVACLRRSTSGSSTGKRSAHLR
jgi:hypothetical protein